MAASIRATASGVSQKLWNRGALEAGILLTAAAVASGVIFGAGAARATSTTSDGHTYIAGPSGTLLDLNPATGEPKTQIVASASATDADVQQGNGVVLVTTPDGKTIAIDMATVTESTAPSGKEVKKLLRNGQIYTADLETGVVRKVDPVSWASLGGDYKAADALSDVAVDESDTVWALTKSGQIASVSWSESAGRLVQKDTTKLDGVADGAVLVPHEKGVTAISPKNGVVQQIGTGNDRAGVSKSLQGEAIPAAASPASLVAVSIPSTKTVAIVNDTGLVTVSVSGRGCADPGKPAVFDGLIYVPCKGDSKTIVLDKNGGQGAPDIPSPDGDRPTVTHDDDHVVVSSNGGTHATHIDSKGHRSPVQLVTDHAPQVKTNDDKWGGGKKGNGKKNDKPDKPKSSSPPPTTSSAPSSTAPVTSSDSASSSAAPSSASGSSEQSSSGSGQSGSSGNGNGTGPGNGSGSGSSGSQSGSSSSSGDSSSSDAPSDTSSTSASSAPTSSDAPTSTTPPPPTTAPTTPPPPTTLPPPPTTDPPPPPTQHSAPANVTASAIAGTSAVVSWSIPEAPTAISVQSSTGQVTTVAADATSAGIGGLAPGTTYTFTVIFTFADGQQTSATSSAVTTPGEEGAPGNVTATEQSTGIYQLTWTPAPGSPVRYELREHTVNQSGGVIRDQTYSITPDRTSWNWSYGLAVQNIAKCDTGPTLPQETIAPDNGGYYQTVVVGNSTLTLVAVYSSGAEHTASPVQAQAVTQQYVGGPVDDPNCPDQQLPFSGDTGELGGAMINGAGASDAAGIPTRYLVALALLGAAIVVRRLRLAHPMTTASDLKESR